MQVVIDGILTHYEKSGQGKRILMLHGWGDALETFQQLVADLNSSYEVTRLDLPGFGQTEGPKTAWNLTNYADFVASFLGKVTDGEVYAVIGHSNGGALAIHALANDTLHTQKLVLLAASGVRDGQSLRRMVLKIIAKTGKVATFWLPKSTRAKLQKKLYGSVGSDMLVAPHLQETFKQTVRQDIQDDARKLTLPTLLMYGDQDKATPLKTVGEVLHSEIKDSKLVVVPGVDHFVHHGGVQDVSRTIQEFLA